MRVTIAAMHSFTRGEQKSLAYHRAVAQKLRANPSLVDNVSRRLQWLREMNPAARAYYDEWQRLLQGSFDDLIAALLSESERSCALRQENPFCDLVSQPERAAIYRAVAQQIDRDHVNETRGA